MRGWWCTVLAASLLALVAADRYWGAASVSEAFMRSFLRPMDPETFFKDD